MAFAAIVANSRSYGNDIIPTTTPQSYQKTTDIKSTTTTTYIAL